jgi:sialate O-acetylesterase
MNKQNTTSIKKIPAKQSTKIFLIVLFWLICLFIHGQVKLPKVFSDNMVLQRDLNIPVWGTSEPNSSVTVKIGNTITKTSTDRDGKWELKLPPMKAGGPHLMQVFKNEVPKPEIELKNILIGDVWFASGQSNMEWQVQQSFNAEEEIKKANYPNIRFLKVPHNKEIDLQTDIIGGKWSICDSQSVKTISAVAYYYARELHEELNIPIGILQSTWGGTPVEAWTSREMLLSSEISRNDVLLNDSITPDHFTKDSLDLIRFWDIVYHPKNKTDKTIPGNKIDDSDWPVIEMPKKIMNWDIPIYEGIIWMRKSITIPEKMLGKDLTIHLGLPEMNYSLYFNEHEICKTVWNANPIHHYKLKSETVKKGTNHISVRMAFLWKDGGFNPPADSMYVTDGKNKISLAGSWKFMRDLEPVVPKIYYYHQYPTFLFNAMIHPVIPYGIKGFIWYQGENNVPEAINYRTLFPMMITDWRTRWQQGPLPFLYVQLPNYEASPHKPSLDKWAQLREAQTMALKLPNTGMACIIDIGEAKNIHPKNKQEVGRRLALLAKDKVYSLPVKSSGPFYKSHRIERDKVLIEFSETGKGLCTRENEKLVGFSIAGADKKFYAADAEITKDKVTVYSARVKSPMAVRYAWSDNPDCNLINREGLPAAPFRTDSWRIEEEE